jgi:hypothetical protein
MNDRGIEPHLPVFDKSKRADARDEFHLAAIAQKLRKPAKLFPGPQNIPATQVNEFPLPARPLGGAAPVRVQR